MKAIVKRPQPLVVLSNVAKISDANRIAKTLVAEKLAACVNILPGIRSHYVWKGKTCSESEILLLIKTLPRTYKRLEKRLRALHPYDCPEIIALPASDSFSPYRRWLESGVL